MENNKCPIHNITLEDGVCIWCWEKETFTKEDEE